MFFHRILSFLNKMRVLRVSSNTKNILKLKVLILPNTLTKVCTFDVKLTQTVMLSSFTVFLRLIRKILIHVIQLLPMLSKLT